MNCESLIFDIDGTLWDTRELIARAYTLQLRQEGLSHIHVDAEMFRPLFGKVDTDIADVVFATVPKPERYKLMHRCMAAEDRLMEELPSYEGYPGVKQTLVELKKNHRLFIVSNSQVGYPQACIEKMGLEDLIRDSLCFGQTGTPKGQTIRTLMARNGITSCAYIGDTQMDWEATVQAGIPFIWASYGFGTPEKFHGKIQKFSDLLEIFP